MNWIRNLKDVPDRLKGVELAIREKGKQDRDRLTEWCQWRVATQSEVHRLAQQVKQLQLQVQTLNAPRRGKPDDDEPND